MGANNICSDLYGDPALALVDSAWGIFQGYAEDGLARALSQIDALNSFHVTFQNWDASFDATGELSGFQRPARPTLPTITAVDLSGDVPAVPTINIGPIAVDNPPDEPDALNNPPILDFTYTAPVLNATAPGDAPTMSIGDAPEAPTLVFPDAPVLEQITVPDAPTITIDLFAEAVPEFDAPVPSEAVDFAETLYDSPLLTQVKAQISTMLDGGTGLPPAVANALWGRAVSRDDQSSNKALQEIREDHASRGFEEPDGILGRRLDEVRQTNRLSRSNLNRDVFIQEETVAIENLRFAVSQGLAAESTLLQAHLAIQQRKFDLAMGIKNIALAVFNAQVSRYNALVTTYNARVEAYRAFLDGQRARVDVYRAAVEAAKAKGEINVQRAQVYAEQIRGEATRADAYRSEIEGFKAKIDAERARIEGYRATVDAYRAQVDAYATEWQAVQTQLQAEIGKGKIYETIVDGYTGRVGVWAKKQDVRIETHRENLVNADATLKQHQGAIEAFRAKLAALAAYIDAQSRQSDSTARMYEADARIEGAAVDADNRAFQAMTERARAKSDAADRNASLQISQATTYASLLLRALESAAQASTQLAASAVSAVNFSAGVSSSQGRSKSCNTSFNYSGEIADAGA